MRRCTGLRPSRTSGSARETMTDMEYSMNERSISSWISMGSMNPRTGTPPPSSASCPFALCPLVDVLRVVRFGGMSPTSSDVEEARVLRVGLDEVPALLDVVTHQDGADLVGQRSLLDVDLQQRALGRIDGGLLELVEVHLPEPLQPLEVRLVVGVLGQEVVLGHVIAQIELLLADERRVEGWLGHVDESALDQRLHLAEEEGEQERADVGPVDVRVGQQNHLVVADLGDVEVVGQAGPDRRDQGLDLNVLQHLVDAGPLDVQDLQIRRA